MCSLVQKGELWRKMELKPKPAVEDLSQDCLFRSFSFYLMDPFALQNDAMMRNAFLFLLSHKASQD